MSDLPILCCLTTERLKLSYTNHAVTPIYFQLDVKPENGDSKNRKPR